MTKNQKIVLGVFTILPFVGFILAIFAFISAFTFISTNFDPVTTGAFPTAFIGTFILIGLLSLLSLGLLIYYIIHAINNKNLKNEERIVWILLFIFIANIAFIIYWIMRIWNDKTPIEKPNNAQYLDDQI